MTVTAVNLAAGDKLQMLVSRAQITNDALTIQFTNPDSNRITVPATVTIPAGAATASFVITALKPTLSGHPVELRAAAVGNLRPSSLPRCYLADWD